VSSKDLRTKKIRAFILLTMRPGTSEEIVQSRKIKGVTLANSVLGRFDAIAVVEANNSEELTKIIYEMIEKHPNVVHTETLLSMFTP
jgi:DNA-binding Lrp family transcriptional regulator